MYEVYLSYNITDLHNHEDDSYDARWHTFLPSAAGMTCVGAPSRAGMAGVELKHLQWMSVMVNIAMAVEPCHYGPKISGCNREAATLKIMKLCLIQVITIVTQVHCTYIMYYTCKSSTYIIIAIRLRNGCDFSITFLLVTAEIHLCYSEKDTLIAQKN